MKKYILSILSLLFFNTVYSQVLYNETFNNYILGNLSNDVTGQIPGQGGWLTQNELKTGTSGPNAYSITAYPNRGKVLMLSVPPLLDGDFYVRKTNLDVFIDNRSFGNNVIKFEIDFYTGPQHYTGFNGGGIDLRSDNLPPFTGGYGYKHLIDWRFSTSNDGYVRCIISDGNGGARHYSLDNNNPFTTMPFNTWIKFIAYLDYTNKKAYIETPYLGTVIAVDFLHNSTSTDLMKDHKVTSLTMNNAAGSVSSGYNVMRRYDNIKITALNAVPPEVIALSVDDVVSEKCHLYPNTATDVVNITNSENMFVNQVVVYDVTGKQLNTQTFNNESEIQLNVENLASGVYMLHLQTNEGTAIKKLVKK